MKNIFKTIILAMLFLTFSAFAFEGELTYDVHEDGLAKNVPPSKIKIYLLDSRMRIDYISSNDADSVSAYINYFLRIGHFVKNKSSKRIDLTTPFKSPDFLMPEEMTKTGQTKIIFESKTNEFETFYFINKTRLPLKVWYSPHTFQGSYFLVWHLFSLRPDMVIANFFINSISRQICYEMNFTTLDGKKFTYKLVKINKTKPNESSFDPP